MEDGKGNHDGKGRFWGLELHFSNLHLEDLGLILGKPFRYSQRGAKEESKCV